MASWLRRGTMASDQALPFAAIFATARRLHQARTRFIIYRYAAS